MFESGPPGIAAREYEFPFPRQFGKDFQRLPGQRHAVLAAAFHAGTGNGPHTSSRSISGQRAPITSPVRAAVRIMNSSARAPCLVALATRPRIPGAPGTAAPDGAGSSRSCCGRAAARRCGRASVPGFRRCDSRARSPNPRSVRCDRAGARQCRGGPAKAALVGSPLPAMSCSSTFIPPWCRPPAPPGRR